MKKFLIITIATLLMVGSAVAQGRHWDPYRHGWVIHPYDEPPVIVQPPVVYPPPVYYPRERCDQILFFTHCY